MELTILMPCLNEAETIGKCIRKANLFLHENEINGEVVIGDNGSTDGSQSLAIALGAKVIDVPQKGYGSALIGGINAANGKYIIMGDSDDSYDFSKLGGYVEKLREGYDLVMGNRFNGGISKGAMPFLHRYLGNPVLSFLGRLFFSSSIRDFHCGLRGFSKVAFEKMDLKCTGMEFASEMVVKATLLKLKIAEVPTILYPDGRSRPPHLRTWRDGWRHLRFLLMYSPIWLFYYPGILLSLLGLGFSIKILFGGLVVFGVGFSVHTLIYTFSLIVIGLQAIAFYVFTNRYAYQSGLLPKKVSRIDKTIFNLEIGLIMGALLLVVGLVLTIYAIEIWNEADFGKLVNENVIKLVITASTSFILGFQIILYSFFYSILGLANKQSNV